MENERPSFRRFDLSGTLPGGLLQSIVINVALPYMLYQFLIPRTSSLNTHLIVALFPLFGLVSSLYQKRILDLIAVGALITTALSLAYSFIPGDYTWFLLHIALPVGLLGIVLLLTRWSRRPILFYVDRFFSAHNESQVAQYNTYWQNNAHYRATVTIMNSVWGISQIMLAGILIILFFTLTIDTFQPIRSFVQYGIYAVYIALTVWTVQYKSTHAHHWQKEEGILREPELRV